MAEEKDTTEDLIPHSARVNLCIAAAICLPFIFAFWRLATQNT